MSGIDVTENIRTIERLKAGILNDVARLYSDMLPGSSDADARLDTLAELSLRTYMIAQMLGISPAALDARVTGRLRRALLSESDPLHSEAQALAGRMDREKER